jgi:hypothetical protein
MVELLRYYQKVASRVGWIYVILHPIKLKKELDVIRFLADKFGVWYLYESWVKHGHLQTYSGIVVMYEDYISGRGKNYQLVLRKIFGAL